MVVSFHIGRMLLAKMGTDITWLTTVGAAGVDLFFVVSGFIMFYTTAEGGFSTADFLWRRVVRVVPLYWIILLSYGALILVVPHRDPVGGLNYAAAFAFLPTFNPAHMIYPPVDQGWTLAYEAFFYVALAAA